jgi:hypothetical protein
VTNFPRGSIGRRYWHSRETLTREQAIAYMREKTGMGEKEVNEIERYIVAPARRAPTKSAC